MLAEDYIAFKDIFSAYPFDSHLFILPRRTINGVSGTFYFVHRAQAKLRRLVFVDVSCLFRLILCSVELCYT